MGNRAVRVVPDANVLLRVLRQREAAERFRRFVARRASTMAVASVVEMELRAGARTPAQLATADRLLEAVAAADRRLSPSAVAIREAGRVMADLAVHERVDSAAQRGSFVVDVLLAVTCREHDALLVTHNSGDFARIQRHLRGFRFVTAWPT